ncbi:Zinc carboxypeptidase [Filimonas lacunae]|uniref:Zinc carboxypeptidase n=1 Tax=Filimonas lacunae TaxID=477680 RepID=A0A173MH69_9BACT|nr:M14 family metallopeptidase [Filimonas lacunae]BAV06964.1 hypothetical protein FLA_2984 [Filimonas lacunae]SIS97152.1 Zinc carboxypeptidase [Filimonas lacunae]
MRKLIVPVFLLLTVMAKAQNFSTPFEKSAGKQTTTYEECIRFYRQLDSYSKRVAMKEMGKSDAGYPLHVVLYANNGVANPAEWHKQGKVVILINNGIHPGEPDGIDASMLLLRDLATGKARIPDNVALAVIPLYNIGGALNRNSYSRVNQDGPENYGFRGNAQNLDLNRDFTKNDSWEARAFVQIFHWVNPDIQIDNHVSDGADYQYTMTLLCSQWNKLGGSLGVFLHDVFQPALFEGMEKSGWPLTPYVNFEEGNPDKGWEAFYDPPRFSSGYATLFHTIAFMPETHMLKAFAARVKATYAMMETIIAKGAAYAIDILEKRRENIINYVGNGQGALRWQVDTTRWDNISFRGYETGTKVSEVTGMHRMYYDHTRPFERKVKFFNYYTPVQGVSVPKAYVIPQGWHAVIELLRLNQVDMRQITHDTIMKVGVYRIADYRSNSRPYEKHHKNGSVKVARTSDAVVFRKGDYLIATAQPACRFLVEMLEPEGDDSYFAWNFFDAVLQEKEGYSDYRWEDVAAEWIKAHPEVKQALDDKKKTDSAFAGNASAQLEFVYKHSPYYEPEHMRYPVYRIE